MKLMEIVKNISKQEIINNYFPQKNDIPEMEKFTDDVVFELYSDKRNKTISLVNIYVLNQNVGVGTRFMNDLVNYADKVGYMITLSPGRELGSKVTELIEFYKKFGFVKNAGKYKINSSADTMYRLPK